MFEALRDELAADLAGTRWDAAYLSLHGAAITRSRLAPDLDLARIVRDAVGEAPVAASFDLHANLNPEMAKLVDIASGYRTYPHVDMRETAARVLGFLERTVAGEIRPVGAIRNTGRLLGSFNMRTDAGPMAALQALARARESTPVLDVSVFGGFPYADTPDCGASVMVYADGSRAAAAEAAAEMANCDLRSRARVRAGARHAAGGTAAGARIAAGARGHHRPGRQPLLRRRGGYAGPLRRPDAPRPAGAGGLRLFLRSGSGRHRLARRTSGRTSTCCSAGSRARRSDAGSRSKRTWCG